MTGVVRVTRRLLRDWTSVGEETTREGMMMGRAVEENLGLDEDGPEGAVRGMRRMMGWVRVSLSVKS
jgi:hypothetical protein